MTDTQPADLDAIEARLTGFIAFGDSVDVARDVGVLLAEVQQLRDEVEARTIERDSAQAFREDNAAAAERIMLRAKDAEAERDQARADLAVAVAEAEQARGALVELRGELDACRTWQAKRIVALSQDPTTLGFLKRAERAEASVQAVEALCDEAESYCDADGRPAPEGTVAVAEVRAALDGTR